MKFSTAVIAITTCSALLLSFSNSVCAEEKQVQDKAKAQTEKVQGDPAIRLESVFVGDKEQPAISYFIPWQGIGAPDKLNWNVEQKHDNALNLVDREIMLRSINIYEEMNLENISSSN